MATIAVSDTTQTFENVMFSRYDSHYNFAYSTVQTAPSPASSGTQLTVATGTGSQLSPGTYNATVWPIGSQPSQANAEIVRVTGKSGDILQIARTQEQTSARSIQVGDQIASILSAKTITDVEGETYLPVKGMVYRANSANSGNGAFALVSFDSVVFDTGDNYSAATGKMTASIPGYYACGWGISSNAATTRFISSLYKNGSEYTRGNDVDVSITTFTSVGTSFLLLNAGDFLQIECFANTTTALVVNSTQTYFYWYLVSQN